MAYGVESRRVVKQYDDCFLSLIYRQEKIIEYAKHSSFNTVCFPICRLRSTIQIVLAMNFRLATGLKFFSSFGSRVGFLMTGAITACFAESGNSPFSRLACQWSSILVVNDGSSGDFHDLK